jgi:integrase
MRRQRQRSGFPTRKAAEAHLAGLLGEIGTGAVADTGRRLLSSWLDEWLESIESSVSPSTYELNRTAVTKWVVPRLGALRLSEVTPKHVQDFVRDLQKTGGRSGGELGPRSVRQAHQVLAKAFDRAVEWRLTPNNPARQGITLPKMEHRQMRPLDTSEVRRFLEVTEGDRLGPLWCLLVTTGLRRGEALGLRWHDVSLTNAQLQVRQTIITVGGAVQVSTPKTSTSRRVVYLSSRTVEALELQRRRQEEERTVAGAAWTESDLVFTTALGTPLHPRNVLRDFQGALEKAGITKIRIHDLRHTAATLLLQEGVNPKVVQELLGHSRVAITLDIYSHTTEGLHREAADVMDLALKS